MFDYEIEQLVSDSLRQLEEILAKDDEGAKILEIQKISASDFSVFLQLSNGIFHDVFSVNRIAKYELQFGIKTVLHNVYSIDELEVKMHIINFWAYRSIFSFPPEEMVDLAIKIKELEISPHALFFAQRHFEEVSKNE